MKLSVKRIILLTALIINFTIYPAFAITTGVVFQDVETHELAGATISLPGFEPQKLEEDDNAWNTDSETTLLASTIGIAIISTSAGDTPVTFSLASTGEMIITPALIGSDGQIASLIDPAGQKILIGYDDSGRISSLEEPSGQVTSLAYDTEGKPSAMTQPAPGSAAVHSPSWKNVLLNGPTGTITGLLYGKDGSVVVTDNATALLNTGNNIASSSAADMSVAIRNHSETTTLTETTSCTPTLAGGPIAIGPKSEIGGGMAKVVDDFTSKMVSKGIGSLLGGSGFSFGGGGGGGSKTPELNVQKNPVKKLQPFTVPGTDIVVNVGGMISDDGKLLISSELENAPGKGTYHSVTLHNMECQRMQPIRYIPYGLYLEWSLSVQYTHTTEHYVDGELVSRTVEQTDWEEIDSGKELLGTGAIGIRDKDLRTTEPGIWQQFGFDRATSGLDALGTLFNVGYEDLQKPIAVSINITQPDLDPVMIAPLNLFLDPKDGGISFVPVEDVVEEIKLDYSRMLKFDGGMTQIDPPTLDLSAGNDGPIDSVIDDLQPYNLAGDSEQKPPATFALPESFSSNFPLWADAAKLDFDSGLNGKDSPPRDAGDDFMEAFINAFGQNGE